LISLGFLAELAFPGVANAHPGGSPVGGPLSSHSPITHAAPVVFSHQSPFVQSVPHAYSFPLGHSPFSHSLQPGFLPPLKFTSLTQTGQVTYSSSLQYAPLTVTTQDGSPSSLGNTATNQLVPISIPSRLTGHTPGLGPGFNGHPNRNSQSSNQTIYIQSGSSSSSSSSNSSQPGIFTYRQS
jgi:hypothetical protein